jgi:hypothetical protein
MTQFKPGDKAYHRLRGEWVTLETYNDSLYSLCYYFNGVQYKCTIDGKDHHRDKYPVLLDHEPEEHKWTPKKGDLCWFWDFKGIKSFAVSPFDHMNGEKFVSQGGQDWNFCAPFEGELPKGEEL